MNQRGFPSAPSEPGIEVVTGGRTVDNNLDALLDAALVEQPSVNELLEGARNLEREKWDWALPPELLKKAYASLNLDVEEAKKWVSLNFSGA